MGQVRKYEYGISILDKQYSINITLLEWDNCIVLVQDVKIFQTDYHVTVSKIFSCIFTVGDLWAHLHTLHWVFSSFWPETAWPPRPTLRIHPISLQATCFCSPDEKVLKGKHVANMEETKQKTAEALKGIKIDKFKNCFKQWKKWFSRCIKCRVLWRWLTFKHVRTNTQFFINKFGGYLGGDPSGVKLPV